MTKPKEKLTYASSPLGRVATEALAKIAHLKKKYPPATDGKSSAEHLHALKSLELIELVFEKLHSTILPQFNGYNNPGLFGIITDLFQLRSQAYSVFDKNLEEFALTIDHPSTFELAEFLIKCAKNAPAEVKDIIPFLNPDVLNANCHKGMLGTLVGGFLGYTFVLEKKKSAQTPYIYNFTTHSEGKTETKVVEATEIYHEYSSYYLNVLLNKIKIYFSENAHTPYVKSQLARANLLHRLTEEKIASLTHQISLHRDECTVLLDVTHANKIEAIHLLNQEIARNESLQKDNIQLQSTLTMKLQRYRTETVEQLVEKHPHLKGQLQSAETEGLGISYCSAVLPDYVVGIDDNFPDTVKVFPIQKKLEVFIEEELTILRNTHAELQHKVLNLEQERHHFIDAWQQETLQTNYAMIQKRVSSLGTLQHTFETISHERTELPANHTVEALQKAIMTNQAQCAKLTQLSHDVILLREEVERSVTLPAELAVLDSNNTVQTAKTRQSSAVIQQAQALLKQTATLHQSYNKETQHWQEQIEKAEAEAKFAANMQIADPGKLRQLLESTSLRAKDIEQQQKQSELSTQSLSMTISTLEVVLEQLDTETKQIDLSIAVLRQSNTDLIQALLLLAQKYLSAMPQSKGEELTESEPLCLAFIDNLIQSINHLLKKREDNDEKPTYYQNMRALLDEVSTCLQASHKNSIIPFKAIEKLQSMQTIMTGTKQGGRFESFLRVIGLQDTRNWKIYREHQDDIFKFKPSPAEYAKQSRLLTDAIATTRSELDQQELIVEVISDLSQKVPVTKEQLKDNFREISTLEIKLSSIRLQRPQRVQSLETIKESYEASTQRQLVLIKEKEQIERDQRVLSGIKGIIDGLESLREQIQLLENGDDPSFIDDSVYQQIAILKQKLRELISTAQSIELVATLSDKAQVYQSNISTIYQLLDSSNHSLAALIKSKVNMSPMQAQLSSYQDELNKLKMRHEQLAWSKPLANESELVEFKELVTSYGQLIVLINAQKEIIETLEANVSIINDGHSNQVLEDIKLAYAGLKQESEQVGQLLLNDSISGLSHLKNEAKVFQDHGFQESDETQAVTSAKIAEIQQYLTHLPRDEDLQLISTDVRLVGSIKSLRSEVEGQLSRSAAVNRGLEQRMVKRTGIVNQLLIPKLETYWQERERSYLLKDFIMPHDRVARLSLINTLKIQLAEYSHSGNSKEVLQTIKQNIKLYDGIHLKAILYKITAELTDLDKETPKEYYKEAALPKDLTSLHSEATELLQQLEPKHQKYTAALKQLYAQIDAMAAYWDQAADLTNKLRSDLDGFVLAHKQELPTDKEYRRFKKQFTARLHSEDDVMSKHREPWKANLANFAIGFFTLGIALGIKLLYSKINDGRCRFFFHETNREKQILAMQEQVQSITAPVA